MPPITSTIIKNTIDDALLDGLDEKSFTTIKVLDQLPNPILYLPDHGAVGIPSVEAFLPVVNAGDIQIRNPNWTKWVTEIGREVVEKELGVYGFELRVKDVSLGMEAAQKATASGGVGTLGVWFPGVKKEVLRFRHPEEGEGLLVEAGLGVGQAAVAAWYNGVVVEGGEGMVVLRYDIVYTGKGERPVLPKNGQTSGPLESVMEAWSKQGEEMKCFVWRLYGYYDEEKILKPGRDNVKVKLLAEVAKKKGLRMYTAHATYEKAGSTEDDCDLDGWMGVEEGVAKGWKIDDIDEELVELKNFVDGDGIALPKQCKSSPELEDLGDDDFWDDLGDPDDAEYDNGRLSQRWDFTVVFLWPAANHGECSGKFFGKGAIGFLEKQYWPDTEEAQKEREYLTEGVISEPTLDLRPSRYSTDYDKKRQGQILYEIVTTRKRPDLFIKLLTKTGETTDYTIIKGLEIFDLQREAKEDFILKCLEALGDRDYEYSSEPVYTTKLGTIRDAYKDDDEACCRVMSTFLDTQDQKKKENLRNHLKILDNKLGGVVMRSCIIPRVQKFDDSDAWVKYLSFIDDRLTINTALPQVVAAFDPAPKPQHQVVTACYTPYYSTPIPQEDPKMVFNKDLFSLCLTANLDLAIAVWSKIQAAASKQAAGLSSLQSCSFWFNYLQQFLSCFESGATRTIPPAFTPFLREKMDLLLSLQGPKPDKNTFRPTYSLPPLGTAAQSHCDQCRDLNKFLVSDQAWCSIPKTTVSSRPHLFEQLKKYPTVRSNVNVTKRIMELTKAKPDDFNAVVRKWEEKREPLVSLVMSCPQTEVWGDAILAAVRGKLEAARGEGRVEVERTGQQEPVSKKRKIETVDLTED